MAARQPSVSTAGWTDSAFARVAEIVRLVAGLEFPPNRQQSAEAGMRRAMSALRIADPQALARAIGTRGEARDAVLAELTVGESYFFREAGQLDLLRTTVLPSIESAGIARTLRLWSAGCASGEEPYTLAILLRELGWSQPVRILATDVARPRLAAARRGRYTRWALRGVSDARIDRWFARRGPHFQLDAEIRAAVQFEALNLVEDEYPTADTGTAGQDMILCRNVLIYFDMPVVALIAARLLASLAPDGWLVCGASDPLLVGVVPCEAVMTPSGMAYRRADRPGRPAEPGLPEQAAREGTGAWPTVSPATPGSAPGLFGVTRAPAEAAPVHELTTAPMLVRAPADRLPPASADQPSPPDAAPDVVAYAAADYVAAERLGREQLAVDRSAETWERLVRSIANQGRLRDAEVACVAALDEHRLAAGLHHLHATLLAEAGQLAEAAKACRRALYLDRTRAVVYLQLGDVLARLGERDAARRAFANAREFLATLPDDQPVAGADGVPLRRLREIAAQRHDAFAGGVG